MTDASLTLSIQGKVCHYIIQPMVQLKNLGLQDTYTIKAKLVIVRISRFVDPSRSHNRVTLKQNSTGWSCVTTGELPHNLGLHVLFVQHAACSTQVMVLLLSAHVMLLGPRRSEIEVEPEKHTGEWDDHIHASF